MLSKHAAFLAGRRGEVASRAAWCGQGAGECSLVLQRWPRPELGVCRESEGLELSTGSSSK